MIDPELLVDYVVENTDHSPLDLYGEDAYLDTERLAALLARAIDLAGHREILQPSSWLNGALGLAAP